MNTFVRTNHLTHLLLRISKIVAVLLFISVPLQSTANPNLKSSSNGYVAPTSVGAQSYQYEPASYQVTSTSSYSFGSTYSPAQTLYTPFSDETPSNSGQSNNASSSTNNRRRIGELTPGDPEPNPESPIGEPWILLAFAAAAAGVITLRKKQTA